MNEINWNDLAACTDACPECDARPTFPLRIHRASDDSVQLQYACKQCGNEWRTSWSMELALRHHKQSFAAMEMRAQMLSTIGARRASELQEPQGAIEAVGQSPAV